MISANAVVFTALNHVEDDHLAITVAPSKQTVKILHPAVTNGQIEVDALITRDRDEQFVNVWTSRADVPQVFKATPAGACNATQGSVVNAMGRGADGSLVMAQGAIRTVENSTYGCDYSLHNPGTTSGKGFSGSLVFAGRAVLGVHLGGNTSTNFVTKCPLNTPPTPNTDAQGRLD
jgi:hypothetical protein